jgi:hypothetical protein
MSILFTLMITGTVTSFSPPMDGASCQRALSAWEVRMASFASYRVGTAVCLPLTMEVRK